VGYFLFEQIGVSRLLVASSCLRSAIPENCAFLAKLSEPSFRMTNEKFSMTNFQFNLTALVAAGRAAPLRLCVETSFLSVKSVVQSLWLRGHRALKVVSFIL
jgi:hypothetical protein